MIEFLRYIGKLRWKKNESCTFRKRKRWKYVIFREVKFGKFWKENYTFGFFHLAETPASFTVLTTIWFIQYSRHKSHIKIHFLHRAAVSLLPRYFVLLLLYYVLLLIHILLLFFPGSPFTITCLGAGVGSVSEAVSKAKSQASVVAAGQVSQTLMPRVEGPSVFRTPIRHF